jgi:hypothetical protein
MSACKPPSPFQAHFHPHVLLHPSAWLQPSFYPFLKHIVGGSHVHSSDLSAVLELMLIAGQLMVQMHLHSMGCSYGSPQPTRMQMSRASVWPHEFSNSTKGNSHALAARQFSSQCHAPSVSLTPHTAHTPLQPTALQANMHCSGCKPSQQAVRTATHCKPASPCSKHNKNIVRQPVYKQTHIDGQSLCKHTVLQLATPPTDGLPTS